MAEFITLIANVSLALSFLVALVFGIAQVKTAGRDRRERLTLETLRAFQTRDFAELIHYVTTHDLPKTREEQLRLPSNEQIIFIEFAQKMESLGLQVAEGLIDIDLVDKTLGSFVTTAWEKYRPVFMDIRKNAPDPFLGEYFEWLAKQIDERMRQSPRRPFYEIQTASEPGVKQKF
jgi:hypothetical protein